MKMSVRPWDNAVRGGECANVASDGKKNVKEKVMHDEIGQGGSVHEDVRYNMMSQTIQRKIS